MPRNIRERRVSSSSSESDGEQSEKKVEEKTSIKYAHNFFL